MRCSEHSRIEVYNDIWWNDSTKVPKDRDSLSASQLTPNSFVSTDKCMMKFLVQYTTWSTIYETTKFNPIAVIDSVQGNYKDTTPLAAHPGYHEWLLKSLGSVPVAQLSYSVAEQTEQTAYHKRSHGYHILYHPLESTLWLVYQYTTTAASALMTEERKRQRASLKLTI